MSGKNFYLQRFGKRILTQTKSPIPLFPQKSNGQPHRGWERSRRIWHLSRCHLSTKWLAHVQGHPTDLFLTISVLQRTFCWLGTGFFAVLLGTWVLSLLKRIYRMCQKFLLELFHPSNLLEFFLRCVYFCARCWYINRWPKNLHVAPLKIMSNQATLGLPPYLRSSHAGQFKR